ncbi:unnamed protein product [Adineta ricciae]|uniref:Uncharacterized protein n=1 Tax=Adineta ricciae TaxID=249248 RepID=A0A815YAP8_ADIRI|nr:unnamed protein product [Adineta ricciae]
MFQHSLATHLQLNPLIDQVNQIQDQLKGLDKMVILQKSFQQLEEWRQKAHLAVDAYFTEKIQELDAYATEQMKQHEEELLEIRTRIITSMNEQDTTHELIHLLTFKIQTLQRDIDRLTQNDFHLQTNPLVIDKNTINYEQVFNLTNILSVHRVIERSGKSYTPLATDNQVLLLHRQDSLVVTDESLATLKLAPWKFGPIYDMCYSTVLKQFIIITEHEVFVLDSNTMVICKVRSIPYQEWFSCTCSSTTLYLSTKVYSSSIVEFNLLRSMSFIKRWESPDTCSREEAIDGIFYNNDKLAIMISNDQERFARLELRAATTLTRIWSMALEIIYSEKQAYRFCLINRDEWLVADHANSKLIHITNDGKMKAICEYHPTPCCAIEMGNNILAVSTQSAIQLHKF